MEQKTCTKCGETKDVAEFRHHHYAADGTSRKRAQCKRCQNRRNARHRRGERGFHPGNVIEAYLRDEKRRSQSHTLSVPELLELFAKETEWRQTEAFHTYYNNYDVYFLDLAAGELKRLAQTLRELYNE